MYTSCWESNRKEILKVYDNLQKKSLVFLNCLVVCFFLFQTLYNTFKMGQVTALNFSQGTTPTRGLKRLEIFPDCFNFCKFLNLNGKN